ncbi:PREDICTED: mediator of RNA polymerase II transcription subunit 4 isoform X4 [Acromyrmex echinatior]|nr:PREDICTED: mediator of RNA polymerase II transcription subunit 4 isoform X4 [Acromyrmex echinatior]XP_011054153.1 PREDICTED: mediator of RNA polymerase II transcription subunit 4 isoform X4 [Acromyrmex echinatior]XP_011054154.1 PREDICTED: mediator of RNA polymerase II transcription subunit 4 isoform X4 [Acromyrmex echinatior]
MIENTIAQKPSKLSSTEHAQLTELLVAKDNELKATLKRAAEQAKINLKMEALKAEVERQDQDIQQLQRQLKEAEQILATAIYQAKQKLQSIARANKRPVPSEELIKYAHRISATNAICAPLTWQQGDPRRPYPTDLEMRVGFLGRLSDPSNLPLNGQLLGSHLGVPTDLHRAGHPAGGKSFYIFVVSEPPVSQSNQFAWHPSGEIHMSVGGQGSVAVNTHKQETEDVEVMSTDSSSSSSSDSQ